MNGGNAAQTALLPFCSMTRKRMTPEGIILIGLVTGASVGLPFGRAAWYGIELLAEVALQEAFESLDVAESRVSLEIL